MILSRLKDWEVEINADSADSALLKVENDFDLEGPPRHMTYINKYMVISFTRMIQKSPEMPFKVIGN